MRIVLLMIISLGLLFSSCASEATKAPKDFETIISEKDAKIAELTRENEDLKEDKSEDAEPTPTPEVEPHPSNEPVPMIVEKPVEKILDPQIKAENERLKKQLDGNQKQIENKDRRLQELTRQLGVLQSENIRLKNN